MCRSRLLRSTKKQREAESGRVGWPLTKQISEQDLQVLRCSLKQNSTTFLPNLCLRCSPTCCLGCTSASSSPHQLICPFPEYPGNSPTESISILLGSYLIPSMLMDGLNVYLHLSAMNEFTHLSPFLQLCFKVLIF